MVILDTEYLGLKLKNPIVASASPLSDTIDGMKRLEDAGASAIVCSSLFEEQIFHEGLALNHYLTYGCESTHESTSFFPDYETFSIGPEAHLRLIAQAKQQLNIPIIASLNGVSPTAWTEWAKLVEEVGADAIELNEYYLPTDPQVSGEDIENRYLEVLHMVKSHVKIPVAVKMNPFFSSIANISERFVNQGADGLVMFNRFVQPDFDLETLEVVPHLVLSNSSELRLPLRWVAILWGRVPTDFAITTGVHSAQDVLKSIMAGAKVVMMASELLRNGVQRIGEILSELEAWMNEHEYESLNQMRGSMSQIHVADPAAFERANYAKALQTWRPDPTGTMPWGIR
jgi:dihydroorotate dehydrogenase (fumarate)